MAGMIGSNRTMRVYIDTSVIGGCFDKEFEAGSLRVFDLARQGRLVLLVSEVAVSELQGAPEHVK